MEGKGDDRRHQIIRYNLREIKNKMHFPNQYSEKNYNLPFS